MCGPELTLSHRRALQKPISIIDKEDQWFSIVYIIETQQLRSNKWARAILLDENLNLKFTL